MRHQSGGHRRFSGDRGETKADLEQMLDVFQNSAGEGGWLPEPA